VPVLAALGALRIDPALAEKVLGAALEARGRPLLPRARCDSMGPPGHAARGVADRQGGCAAEGRRGKSEGGGRVVSFGGDRDRRRAGAMGRQPAASAASGRGLANACAGAPLTALRASRLCRRCRSCARRRLRRPSAWCCAWQPQCAARTTPRRPAPTRGRTRPAPPPAPPARAGGTTWRPPRRACARACARWAARARRRPPRAKRCGAPRARTPAWPPRCSPMSRRASGRRGRGGVGAA